MQNDRPSESRLPVKLNETKALVVLAEDLKPHSDLTYRKIANLEVSDVDLEQSLLTGSLMRRCVWTRVKFRRSDLDGLRIEQCDFVECDFSTCDIRSSYFVECNFRACIFNDSFVDDCEFRKSNLDKCSFRGSSLTRSRFSGTELTACVITPGTFLHNRLYECTITDMLLGDASVSYLILRECKFQRVTLNAESIGAIFGLTPQQLQEAKLVFLGKEEPVPPESDVVALVSNEYHRRQWYLGELTVALNFRGLSTVAAIDRYLAASFPRFVEMGFLKGDDAQFLADVFEELHAVSKLPLLSVMSLLKWCTNLESVLTKSAHPVMTPSTDTLRSLSGRATLLVGSLIDRLDAVIPEFNYPDEEKPVTLVAVFRERPRVELPKLMNSINRSWSLNIRRKSSLVRSEQGSYREIVSTTIFSAVGLQILLFLLNGCVVQLTELKHRVKVLTGTKTPKKYQDLALTPAQQTAPLVLRAIQDIARVTKGLPWLSAPDLGGLDASNIQQLQIEAQPKSSKRRKH